MTLADTTRKPLHHVEIAKDGTTVEIDLADTNGVFDAKAIKKDQQPRLSIKMHQGGTKHSDYEPPYASTEQRDWSGGRGLDDYDLDETRFMDSLRANTWKEGKAMLGPKASFATGHRDSDKNIWTTGSSENSTLVFRSLITSSSYMSVKFTAGASYNAANISFILRKNGDPWPWDVKMSIYDDSGGEPNAELKGKDGGGITIDDLSSELVRVTFSSVQALTASTDYHVVIYNLGDGTAADHWEVGCMYNVGGDGFISADAVTWSSVNYDPYFRITDTNTPLTAFFFDYEEALMAWVSYDDGSAPKLFVNGGYGLATSGGNTTITDTTQSWTTDEFIGSSVLLHGLTGSEVSDRVRRITSNSATALSVSPAWSVNPAPNTRYAIINCDDWKEITGHGITAGPITDVLSTARLIYVCLGDFNDIVRCYYPGTANEAFTRESGNRGTFLESAPDSNGRRKIWKGRRSWVASVDKATAVWGNGSESDLSFDVPNLVTNGDMELDANWDDVGTVATNERSGTQEYDGTYSRHVSVAGDDAGIDQTVVPTSGDTYTVTARIWVVSGVVTMEMGAEVLETVSVTGSWILAQGNRIAASASEEIEFLSSGGAAEFYVDSVVCDEHPTYVGGGYERITSLISYGEPERLWVLTNSGVFMEEHGDLIPIPLKEFASARDDSNGAAATVHDVYLYMSFLDTGVERYYKGNLDDVGPNRDEGLPVSRRGKITSLVGYPGRIYAGIDAGSILGTTGYSSIMLYNSVGWHEVYRHPVVGEAITGLFIQPLPGTDASGTTPGVDRLWFSAGSDIMYLDLDLNPTRNSAYRFHWESWIETSWIYYGKKDITKYWDELKVFMERMDDDTGDDTYIHGQYKVDAGTTWVDIGTFDTEPSETISIGSGITGKRIKFRFLLRTEDMKYTPILLSTITDFIEQVPTKDTYTMTFVVQDNNITLQGSPSFDRAETNMTTLEGWLDDPDPAVISSQISMIDGKSVKILSMGYRPLIVDSLSQKEKLLCTLTVMEV